MPEEKYLCLYPDGTVSKLNIIGFCTVVDGDFPNDQAYYEFLSFLRKTNHDFYVLSVGPSGKRRIAYSRSGMPPIEGLAVLPNVDPLHLYKDF